MNNDPLGTGNFIPGRMPGYTSRPQTQPKKKKGFWQDQISTGGAMGGAAGGAALGAAAGSVVPVIGTAIGGLAGAILGGALGGGAGQRVENAVVGDDLNKDVMKEALLGGAFSVGPIRGANVLAKGGMAAIKGTGVREGIEQGITGTPIRNLIARRSGAASDDLAIRSVRPNPTQLNNFQGKFSEDMGTFIKRNKLVGKDGDAYGSLVGSLDNQFGQAVESIGSIPKQTVINNVLQAAAKMKSAGPGDLALRGQALEDEALSALSRFGDEIPATELNKLKSSYDSLVNFSAKQADPARASVNEKLGNTLRTTLRNVGDERGVSVGGRSLTELGQEVSKARTVKEIADKQAQLGRGGNLLNLSTLLASGAGGVVGGLPGAMATAAAVKAANSSPVVGGAARGLEKLSGALSGRDGGASMLGTAGKVGLGDSLVTALSQPQPQEMAMDEEVPEADIAGYYGLNGAVDESGEQMSQNPFGVSREEVGQQMLLALQSGDRKAFADLKDLYKLIEDFEGGAGGKELNSTVAGQLAMSDNGLGTINQLEELYNQAGGAQGKIGGGLQSLIARNTDLNSNAGAYMDLAGSAETQIAKAIAGGGQVSDADAAAIRKAIPQLTDTPEQAAIKFRDLKARLSNARNNTKLYNSVN